MSINGSGRFRQIYVEDFDRSSFSSSGRSGVYNPQQNSGGLGGNISYEPGTGAEYMYQKGWTNRDAYGKPLPSMTNINRSVKFNYNGDDDDDGLFSKKNR